MTVENTAIDTSTSNPAAPESAGAASPGAPSPASSGTQTENLSGQAQGDGTQALPPAYTPNFKFKAFDKEHEIDPIFRQIIKDAETEKRVRELHEKALGLDGMKPKMTKLQEDFKALEGKYQPLSKNLQTLSAYLNMGDFGTFFNQVGVPENEVFKWVLNKLKAAELPEDQRRIQEEAMTAKRRAYELEQQNQELMQGAQTAEVQVRAQQLDFALAKPEVASAVQAFDQKHGTPGAFRDFVINQATAWYHRTGQDIPPEQAVSEAVRILGFSMGAANPASANPQGMSPQATHAQDAGAQGIASAKPPIIPNVSGRNTSPTKRLPRSIEDLKKLGQGQTLG